MQDDERQDQPDQPEEEQPKEEQPQEEQPEAEQPEAEQPQEEQPEAAAEEQPAEEQEEAPAEEPERPEPRRRRKKDEAKEEEVIPGAHLEPDLVLEEEERRREDEYAAYAEDEAPAEEPAGPEDAVLEEEPAEPAPVEHEPLDLAADARYVATGKRKSAVARVILKPGDGTYKVNGRHLDEFFPRIKLQRTAQQPLEVAGYGSRMDVVARIHGGGVAAQAVALRHGVARALVEADPGLRLELKKRGYLTRDPRVKERKKAGLKKARKRPQFSKR
jgi:small subunit ribosomal protein S9